jgi:hypothetical protein
VDQGLGKGRWSKVNALDWRRVALLVVGLAVAVAGFVALSGDRTASAAPVGAAQSLGVYNQTCTSGGNVQVTFTWAPSGRGSQWFDITTVPDFSAFGNQGPLASNAYYTVWTLEPNVHYYARVNTLANVGFLTSDVLQFTTQNCGVAFTPPHDLDATVFDDFVRLDWEAGNGNLFYCVDTAFTQDDLLDIDGSWFNWGCGTTSTVLDLDNLA